MDVGVAALHLGAGRETKESIIDLSVGIVLNKKVGDLVEKGDVLAYVHYNNQAKRDLAIEKLHHAFEITGAKPRLRPLVFGFVSDKDCRM